MIRFSHTIIFVRDMARSVKFYREAMNLPLRFESPEWTEFATGSCNLALHKAAGGVSPSIDVNQLPAGHCHIGFTVTDLDEFHKQAVAQGVECLAPPKRVNSGERIAVYADPDGLPISVAQAAVSGAAS